MAQYLVQERHFEELRQWKSPRAGWRSVNHYSPWQTVFTANVLGDAETDMNERSHSGMKQFRIRYMGKTLREKM